MEGGDWQGTVHGVAKSWTQLSDWACMLHYETSRTTIGKRGSTPQHTFSQWPLTPMAMLISPKWYHKLRASGRQGGSGSWRRWWELNRRAEPHSGNRGTWEIRGGGALETVCEQVVLRDNKTWFFVKYFFLIVSHFLKVFIEFVTTFFLLYVLGFPGHEACGILALQPGMKPATLHWKVNS